MSQEPKEVQVGLIAWIKRNLRANFFAGLFVAVPLGVTVYVFYILWNWISEPLGKLFKQLYILLFGDSTNPTEGGVAQLPVGDILASLLGLLLVLVLIFLIGFVIRETIGRYVISLFEWIVSKLPVAGVIYTSVKQIGEAILTVEGEKRFQGAVMIEFPSPGQWAVGFITGKVEGILDDATKNPEGETEDRLTIFVPMTPLPSAGFMLVVKQSEVRDLPLSVPEAFKLVVSGGIIPPSDKPGSKKLSAGETGKDPAVPEQIKENVSEK